MKAKKSYKRGGMMEPIIGRFKPKMKKIATLGPKKIDSGVSMDKTLKKSAVEVDKNKKRRKKRRKLDNGGKVKKTSNVNLRGEGKKKGGFRMSEDTYYEGPSGPTIEDYIRGERMARPDLDKIKPLQAKRIKNDAAMKAMVTSPKVQRSTATIPVPAKKKRRLRRK